MAPRPLNPWIADFVKDEIEAVLSWANRKKTTDFIKLENDDRFSDDGSNLRNWITELEPGKDQVQLVEVLSFEKTVTVLLSDGQTCIKGRLSDDAIETFETGLGEGEQLNLEVKGDVIRLKSFTIVTTAFGSEEDYIHFTIDEIEYCHHLRKLVGGPVSVEQDPRIHPLIDRVIKSLVPDVPIDDWEDEEEEEEEEEGSQSQAGSPSIGSQASIDVPRSSPPVEPETQLPGTTAHTHQPRRTTAIPSSARPGGRKRSAAQADLEEDGLEIMSGVNLDRPLNALRKPDTSSHTNKILKGLLLSNQQVEPETVAETPARVLPEPTYQEQHGQQRRILEQETSPDKNQGSPQNASQRPREDALDATGQDDLPSSPPDATVEAYVSPATRNEQVGNTPTTSHHKQLSISYRRRRIPANQKKLLDLESSWLPSLPGQSFPKPNIPIELLKKWNAPPAAPLVATGPDNAATPSRGQSAAPTKAVPHGRGPQKAPAETPTSTRRSPIPSSSSSDSDEEIPSSQWPSSQPQKPDRPPDSSLGSVIRGTPDDAADDLDVSPPKVAAAKKPTTGSPVALRIPSPTRPSKPLPSPAGPPQVRGHSAPSLPALLPGKSIPTGPRNPSASPYYQDRFPTGGHSQYEQHRSGSSQHLPYRSEVASTSRGAHGHRAPFSASRPVSAASSQATSASSSQASPIASRVSSQQYGKPSQRPAQADTRHLSERQVRTPSGSVVNANPPRPTSQTSPMAARASAQHSVEHLPPVAKQTQAKAAPMHPAVVDPLSDKRPAFERELRTPTGSIIRGTSSQPVSQASSKVSSQASRGQSSRPPPFPSTLVSVSPSQARPSSALRPPSVEANRPPSRANSSASQVSSQKPVAHSPRPLQQTPMKAASRPSPATHSPALSAMGPPSERPTRPVSRSNSNASSNRDGRTPAQSSSITPSRTVARQPSERENDPSPRSPIPSRNHPVQSPSGVLPATTFRPDARGPPKSAPNPSNGPSPQALSRPASRSAIQPSNSAAQGSSSAPANRQPLPASSASFPRQTESQPDSPGGPSQIPASRTSSEPTTTGSASREIKRPHKQEPAPRAKATSQGERQAQSPKIVPNTDQAQRAASRPPIQTPSHPSVQPQSRPASRTQNQAPLAPNTHSTSQPTHPPFPVRHPTLGLDPKEMNRRQRKQFRERERLAAAEHNAQARQDRPDSSTQQIATAQATATATATPASHHASTTPLHDPLPAALTSSSSSPAVPNTTDDSNRPKSTPHRRRTGLTGVSGSPANQFRFAAAAAGAGGAQEAGEGGSKEGVVSLTSVERFKERVRLAGERSQVMNVEHVDQTKNRMREFYECYRRLAPGGAFAKGSQGGGLNRNRRKIGVDVLQWDV